MHPAIRILFSLVVSYAVALVLQLTSVAVLGPEAVTENSTAILIVQSVLAVAAGYIMWRTLETRAEGVVRSGLVWGVIVASVGVIVGFMGPQAIGSITGNTDSQGPLLAIFITGPLGLLFGAFGGGMYAWMKKQD